MRHGRNWSRRDRWFIWVGCGLIVLSSLYTIWTWPARHLARTLPSLPGTPDQLANAVLDSADDLRATLRGVNRTPVPILMYHYLREVADPAADPLGVALSVTPADFTAQLEAFQAAGYETITPSQFLAGEIPDKPIMLTFDDGYADFYTHGLPALAHRDMTATVFVIAGRIATQEGGAYLTAEQIREIARAGIEIGAHSMTHPNLAKLDGTHLKDQLLEPRHTLETLIEGRVPALAYPSGHYTDEVLQAAAFYGYRFGVTTEPGIATRGATNLLTLPRIQVKGGESAADVLARIERLTSSE